MTDTHEISAEFIGEVGSVYKFYSIATDNVWQIEATPDDYDAKTTITVETEEIVSMKNTLDIWPNPVKDQLRVSFSNALCGTYMVELVDVSGSVKYSKLCDEQNLRNGITIDVSDCMPGNYILRLLCDRLIETRKVTIW